MAKARPVPGLSAELPFREAAAAVVSVRTEEVFEHADGVLDTADIERVHAMRVATRRLRAALEIFAPCFPRKEHGTLLREVKALADALGERRDPDVQIAALERLEEALGTADRSGIDSLVLELRARQSAGNEALEGALSDSQGLRERLLALTVEVREGDR